MTFRFLHRTLCVGLLIALLASFVTPATAQSSDVGQILARINALRTQNGLLPLDLNSQLTASAQRHSDDMAATGNIDHTGSDGSSIESRIRASGYGHWRDFGIWGENIYGGQLADVDAAWNFWINSQVHRANLLNQRYREVGIGVGQSGKGTYYTLNFGAQPNVLPFFVTGSAPNVTLLLTNEDNITTGEGVAIMGQATQVRVAEGDDTSSAGWQPWAPTISFQLSDAPGPHKITVEYKDDLKRGAKTTRIINVSDLAANPTPTSTATEVTPTVTRTPKATATGEGATATPTLAATTALSTTSAVTLTPTSTATSTATTQPTATATPVATPTSSPTDTPAPPTQAAATITPTSTAIPIASPTLRATATAQLIAANLATYPAASRLTPPAPQPAPPERPVLDNTPSPVGRLFAVLLGLQAIALVGIGAIVIIRLRRRS